ncbi:MAG: PQQ-like beta-propeller repeat protein [Pirellulales bacterium]|nr:PQQ-like beta-propeller repeat protein [Pirellulales bacterium]
MTEVTSPNTTETDPIAEPVSVGTSILPTGSKKLFILSAIIITILRIAEPMDGAMTNALSAMVAILTFALYLAWLLFRSHLSIATRKRIGLTSCIILVIVACMFKITAVDGFLIPTIRLRWAAAPDQSLASINDEILAQDTISTTAGHFDFPKFLGPKGQPLITDAIWNEDSLTPESIRQQWRRPIGAGWSAYSAVSVEAKQEGSKSVSGIAITMQQRDNQEITTAVDIESGAPIWAITNPGRHETVLGGIGPRSTPTIKNGKVYTLGAFGILNCIDVSTGNVIWTHDLLALIGSSAEEDASMISWGRSSSPLVVDNLIIVPLGGKPGKPSHSLIAFDSETGKEKWRAGDRQVSYSSPIVATLDGTRQIVIVTENNVEGHAIEDGALLWQYNDWTGFSNSRASTSQPVPINETDILLTKGYGYGAARIKITRSAEGKTPFVATEVWTNPTVLKTKYTNVVLVGSEIIGLSDGVLQSVDVETGESNWKKGRFGHGQILMVADVLIVQNENGPLHFLKLQERGFQELLEIDAMSDLSWANLCLFENQLLIRNSVETVCYQLPLSRISH